MNSKGSHNPNHNTFSYALLVEAVLVSADEVLRYQYLGFQMQGAESFLCLSRRHFMSLLCS